MNTPWAAIATLAVIGLIGLGALGIVYAIIGRLKTTSFWTRRIAASLALGSLAGIIIGYIFGANRRHDSLAEWFGRAFDTGYRWDPSVILWLCIGAAIAALSAYLWRHRED